MEKIVLGVIKEGKIPPDFRVPLTPKQCALVEQKFPHVKVLVQSSPIRSFTDEMYRAEGVEVIDSMEQCDWLIGVKEVQIHDLIPEKKYLFFSHTMKKQSYNRNLLQAIIDKKIQLTDYEALRNKSGKRIIGFGRYAGIVGCYNGFRTYGLKHNLYTLKRAIDCADRVELEEELKKVILPATTRIVLTGFGRVGYGAREILDLLPIKEVSPKEFDSENFQEAVFTHLDLEDYFQPKNGTAFEKSHFYNAPDEYEACFDKFALKSNIYIACHYWSNKSPYILTQEHLQSKDNCLSVIADISCDIAGPIASTIRPSTIEDPIYGYDPQTGQETDWKAENAIAVMAVDNLPCELPKDASEDFGNELIKNVFPLMFGNDSDGVLDKGTETTLQGELNSHFAYLQSYVDEK